MQGDFNTFYYDYIRAILWNNRKRVKEGGEGKIKYKSESVCRCDGNRFFIIFPPMSNLPQ